MPEGVGVGLDDGDGDGDSDGDAVGSGVGESLADGVALGLGVGVGLTADAGVQPDRTTATALAAESRANRRSIGPVTENHLHVVRPDGVVSCAHGICHTLTAKTQVRFESRSAPCCAAVGWKRSGR
jgi:hypothetical protein